MKMSVLLLLATAASSFAQASPALAPELLQRADHYIRLYVESSPETTLTFGALHPAEIAGYRSLPVTITDQGKTRTAEFLVSNDSKQMLYLSHFDLATDPYKEVMAKIDLRGRPARGASPDAPVTVVVF